jgi:1-acyl-sn-glycerol-3-phosphate acyltransferase
LANRWANVFWHLTRIFTLIWHRVRWIDKQRIPMEGPVILASNHTAGIDPFLIQSSVQRMVRWMMVGKNKFKLLAPMWKAIDPIVLDDNDGRQAIKQIRKFIEVLKNDEIVGIFPEGGLQRDHRDLQKFQVGIGMIAKRTNAWVVPVWIKGTPMRKNMIWHFLEPSKSTVIYGEPYQADQNMSNEEVAEDLRQRMIALAELHEHDQR